MSNFWKLLPKPFLVLAPMQDVTDVVFRQIVSENARPHVFFTEFTSTEALCSEGKEAALKSLLFNESQRPIVAQIWGNDPEMFYKSAKIIKEMGFDGIDINMGCPDKNVLKRCSGAFLIENPTLASELISAVKDGAGQMPVSVKTRIGYKNINTDTWISHLLNQKLDALTVHGRTAAQKSKVKANWSEIHKCVLLKQQISPETIIIGNGDVSDYRESLEKHKRYKVDGVMIGRGIFANPWAFEVIPGQHTNQERLWLLQKHTTLFKDTWGESKNFDVMKKFVKSYVVNFRGSAKIRNELMKCKNYEQMESILSDILIT